MRWLPLLLLTGCATLHNGDTLRDYRADRVRCDARAYAVTPKFLDFASSSFVYGRLYMDCMAAAGWR